jgi:hypothetical protein
MDNNRIRKLRSSGNLLWCGDEFHHFRNTEHAKKDEPNRLGAKEFQKAVGL